MLHAGILLIAEPMMTDPNFRRSVILLCEHNDEGSFGLILNRALTYHLGEVLEYNSAFDTPLYLGGPVEHNTLHVLHQDKSMPRAIRVAEGVYWGGDFDIIEEMLEQGQIEEEKMRFFVGYAGWSAGQLEEEIARKDWIVTQTDTEIVFDLSPDDLWRQVLKKMGGHFRIMANFPEDPKLN
jgi:putative transcriptional regulator